MGVPLDQQSGEVLEGELGPMEAQLAQLHQPAQRLDDLDIEKLGGMEPLVGGKQPLAHASRPRRREEELEQRRGIGDDQRLSRSARNISVGDGRL